MTKDETTKIYGDFFNEPTKSLRPETIDIIYDVVNYVFDHDFLAAKNLINDNGWGYVDDDEQWKAAKRSNNVANKIIDGLMIHMKLKKDPNTKDELEWKQEEESVVAYPYDGSRLGFCICLSTDGLTVYYEETEESEPFDSLKEAKKFCENIYFLS